MKFPAVELGCRADMLPMGNLAERSFKKVPQHSERRVLTRFLPAQQR